MNNSLNYSSILTAVLSGLTAISYSQESIRPNFVVLIADDMGRDDLPFYGPGKVHVPNMEKFASQCMRFDHAFLTASSSSPSRCSILTSLYPHKTGAPGLMQSLPADKEMVSEPLRKIGYFTASIGKWHQGLYVQKQFDLVRTGNLRQPETFGDEVIKMLRERPQDKPFFLWAASTDPHRPYTRDTEKINSPERVYVPPYYPDTTSTCVDLSDYYNEITRFDRHVGMILTELERQKLLDNTFIVIMSDNGRPFPQAKTRCNLQGMSTPLLIYYAPLIKKGCITQALVSSIDIMPTILEIAGTEFSNEVDGRSFADLLTAPEKSFRKYAYAEHNFHDFMAYERAIYTKDFILIRNFLPELPGTPPLDAINGKTFQGMLKLYQDNKLPISQCDVFIEPRKEFELYNYQIDFHCMDNLYENDKFTKVAKKLTKELENWRKSTGDIFPGKENLIEDRFDRTTGKKIREYDMFL